MPAGSRWGSTVPLTIEEEGRSACTCPVRVAISSCATHQTFGRCQPCVACLASPDRLITLEWRQLGGPAHMNAVRLGALSAFACPGDQLALKLCQAAENSEHKPAVRCRRVAPGISQ
jgi:hypothetical protein